MLQGSWEWLLPAQRLIHRFEMIVWTPLPATQKATWLDHRQWHLSLHSIRIARFFFPFICECGLTPKYEHISVSSHGYRSSLTSDWIQLHSTIKQITELISRFFFWSVVLFLLIDISTPYSLHVLCMFEYYLLHHSNRTAGATRMSLKCLTKLVALSSQ